MVGFHHAMRDTALSMAAVCVLLLSLVAVDDRVREQVSLIVGPDTSSVSIANAGSKISLLASIVFSAVRDQSIDHAPLVIFALVAGVLFLLMLRL